MKKNPSGNDRFANAVPVAKGKTQLPETNITV
jgi:hypothetical protein